MNNRMKTGLAVLGLAVAAVPTLTAAHSHYTGRVPASIAVDSMAAPTKPAVLTSTTPRVARTASHKKMLAHKKATAAHTKKATVAAAATKHPAGAKHVAVTKHVVVTKHHKGLHAAKTSTMAVRG